MTGAVVAAAALATAAYGVGALWFATGTWRLGASGRRAGAPTHRPPPGAAEPAPPPSVSVVVAARDEADHVVSCLERLARQTYPADRFEVVLVDDGSTDGTLARARAAARRLQLEGRRVLVLDGSPARGAIGSKKGALELGIASSRGELILTTDADCKVPDTWVTGIVSCFAADVGAVIGFSQIGEPGSACGRLAAWEAFDFLQLMTAAAGSCGHGHPMAASGQSLAFRRSAFEAVGGYSAVRHRVSGDDVLLLQLIRRTGRWRVAFAALPHSFVVHPPSPGLRTFLSRRARWASNATCQLGLDPLFFTYLAAAFAMSVGLAASPALWAAGVVKGWQVGALWAVKGAAELTTALAGARLFGRADLLRTFPAWWLLQPLYTVAVGIAGPLGWFRWKGRSSAFGRQAQPEPRRLPFQGPAAGR